MLNLHLDVLYARTRHIKIAFLIWTDPYFYKQVLVFSSLLKYVFIRCLNIWKYLLYPGIMSLFLF